MALYEDYLEDLLFQKHKESGELRFAALAIGIRPEEPPEWAVRVCYEAAEEWKIVADRDGGDGSNRKRQPRHRKTDGLLLDRMADLVADGYTIHAAAKQVTREESDGPNIRRLQRLWKELSEPIGVFEPSGKITYGNKWTKRANLLRGKVFHPPKRKSDKRTSRSKRELPDTNQE